MVYKKYIKRGGKLYGPYTYHSRRVDGKVISEYHGVAKQPDYKKFVFIFAGVFLLLFSVYFLVYYKGRISGKAVLSIDANYQEGMPLQGVIGISLKEGELIPASSKIILETINEAYEYNLEGLISDSAVEGDFYIKGKEISGSGLGYGKAGKKTVYPPVSFILKIYSSESPEEIPEEEPELTEQPEQNLTTGVNITEIPEEEASENLTIAEETIEEEQEQETSETEQEETSEESSGTEEQAETETAEGGEEQQEEQTEATEETPSSESSGSESESVPAGESSEESGAESGEQESAPLTGNVVSRFFQGVFSFFFRLTGRVTMELEEEINGEVSAGNPFVYNLEEGQTAEVVYSSHNVDMVINQGIVTITTDYSKEEEGFGKDFLTDDEKTFDVDISGLNLTFEKEELTIKLVYDDEEIISLKTPLEEGDINAETEEEFEPEEIINKTEVEEIMNETKEMINESTVDFEILNFLTDEEKKVLFEKFGNLSVKRTAKLFKGRIIVRYEIEERWIENSYDAGMSEEELNSSMERDRIRWLKDIAKELLQEKSEEEELEELEGNYSLY